MGAERRAGLASQGGGLGESTPALPTASHFHKGHAASYSAALGSGFSSCPQAMLLSRGSLRWAQGQHWDYGVLLGVPSG